MPYRSVSFVCPAYNERESFSELIAELHATAAKLGVVHEVVIVDDGSTDGTANALAELAKQDAHLHPVVLRRNYGKATALYVGFQVARGDVIVTLDADLQNDPADIPALLQLLETSGADIATGWKFDRPDTLEKRLPSRFFNAVTRRVSGLHIHDFNAGMKAYRRHAAQALHLYGELHRYIPVLAHSLGYSVVEMKTHTRSRKFGETKYRGKRYLRGALDLLTVLFLTRYSRRPLHLFGGLGLLLGALGSLGILYLVGVKLFSHQAIGTRPLLTFSIFFVLVGLQLLVTGLLAELLVRQGAPSQLPVRDEWNPHALGS